MHNCLKRLVGPIYYESSILCWFRHKREGIFILLFNLNINIDHNEITGIGTNLVQQWIACRWHHWRVNTSKDTLIHLVRPDNRHIHYTSDNCQYRRLTPVTLDLLDHAYIDIPTALTPGRPCRDTAVLMSTLCRCITDILMMKNINRKHLTT